MNRPLLQRDRSRVFASLQVLVERYDEHLSCGEVERAERRGRWGRQVGRREGVRWAQGRRGVAQGRAQGALGRVRAALRATAGRTDGAAAPALAGDRVWSRGVATWFLLQVVDAFGRANALDPTIPRIGLQQLRPLLRPKASKKPKAAKKPGAAKKPDAPSPDAAPPAQPDKG
jgi:hypothetical protein